MFIIQMFITSGIIVQYLLNIVIFTKHYSLFLGRSIFYQITTEKLELDIVPSFVVPLLQSI